MGRRELGEEREGQMVRNGETERGKVEPRRTAGGPGGAVKDGREGHGDRRQRAPVETEIRLWGVGPVSVWTGQRLEWLAWKGSMATW